MLAGINVKFDENNKLHNNMIETTRNHLTKFIQKNELKIIKVRSHEFTL